LKFKDFVTLQRGFDLPKTKMCKGPFPVVGSTSIIGYHNEFKVKPPGVVMGRSGSLGTIQYINEPFWPHNTSLWVKDFKGNNPRFVFYRLQGFNFANFNSGAGVPTLNRNHLDGLELEVTPLPIQHRIVNILSAYDDLIENNTRRIQILEQMAQSIYREWFVHFRFPGHEKVKLVESPLGKIPQGWEVLKLSTLVETQYGYTETSSSEPVGPRYLRGMDINKTSYIQWDTVPFCPISQTDYPRYKLFFGDVVVIRMADPGKAGIVEQDFDAVFASYLIRLKIYSPKLSPYFLFHFLISDYYQGYIKGVSTGTTRKSASSAVITDVEILIPPTSIRQRFEDESGALRKLLTALVKINANLRRTRDLLLPRLISGELSVENTGGNT
jgi:type I restriction enzyme S subunit